MYSVLSLSERLSIHMGSCFFVGLGFKALGFRVPQLCVSCPGHWSENRHVDVSTVLVGSKKAEKVKAGFEEITGEGRWTLSWSGNMAKEKEGPKGGQAQVWRWRWHAAGVRAMLQFRCPGPK